MSRPRTPTALKIIKGNPGKRPLSKDEPKPEIEIPSCPSHLSQIAKAEWKRITPELAKMGLISRIDRAALAGYCSNYATWVQAENLIAERGITVASPNGYEITAPWVTLSHKAATLMLKFLVEFGLTPASRSRVTANPVKKEKSKWSD